MNAGEMTHQQYLNTFFMKHPENPKILEILILTNSHPGNPNSDN